MTNRFTLCTLDSADHVLFLFLHKSVSQYDRKVDHIIVAVVGFCSTSMGIGHWSLVIALQQFDYKRKREKYTIIIHFHWL